MFVLIRDILKALQGANDLYRRWCDLQRDPESPLPNGGNSSEPLPPAGRRAELDALTEELRSTVRGIEWDLDDLAETLDMLIF